MPIAMVQRANLLEHYIKVKKTFLVSFFDNLSDEKKAEIIQEIQDREEELHECEVEEVLSHKEEEENVLRV